MSNESDSTQPIDGTQLVASLMRRQDEVLLEIDALNERIESAIKELSEARKAETEELEATILVDSDSGQVQDTQAQPVRRAA